MKLHKKILTAVLSAVCLVSGACALSACKEEPKAEAPNGEIAAVYELYVASAKERGEAPLTYEAWLALIKGEKGDTGAQGETGPAGLSAYELYKKATGENALSEEEWLASLKGRGVVSVDVNADGTKLVVTYSDKTTEEIPLSKEFHVHDYGEAEIIVPSTKDTQGMSYKICKEDGHIELFLLDYFEGYRVHVTGTNGLPAEGIYVEIGDEAGVTNEEGVAEVNPSAIGHYEISVRDPQGAYGLYDTVVTGLNTDYEIRLVKTVDSGIFQAGKYLVELENYGDFPEVKAVTFTAPEKSTRYTVTVDEKIGVWGMDGETKLIGSYSLSVPKGEMREIDFTFDAEKFPKRDFVKYMITVETEEIEAEGQFVDYALPLTLGENQAEIAFANKEAFFMFEAGRQWAEDDALKLTFGEELTVTYYGRDTHAFLSGVVGEPMKSGQLLTVGAGSRYYFKIKTTAEGGAVNIKAETSPREGSEANPAVLKLGEEKAYSDLLPESVLYSFTAAEAGKYAIVLNKTGAAFYGTEAADQSTELINPISAVTMEAGTYYILAYKTEQDEVSVTVKKFDAATDGGYTAFDPMALTLSGNVAEKTVVRANTSMYFTVTAPEKAGHFTVAVMVGDKDMCKTQGAHGYLASAQIVSSATGDAQCSGGESVSIMINASADWKDFGGEYRLVVTYVEDETATTSLSEDTLVLSDDRRKSI